MNNVLFPLFCCQRMRHKLCTQFSFFQIIKQNVVNDGFRYRILPAIILQIARRSSFKTGATRATMLLFVFVVPSLPLYSASSIESSLATNQLCHQNTVARSTQHGRVTKRFYKYFPHFRSRKSSFTTKFYRGTLFKIFFHGNL